MGLTSARHELLLRVPVHRNTTYGHADKNERKSRVDRFIDARETGFDSDVEDVG